MTKVQPPQGRIATGAKDALTGTRDGSVRYQMLSRRGASLGDLRNVSSGVLEYNANSQVKAGGKIVAADPDDPDLQARARNAGSAVPEWRDGFGKSDLSGWSANIGVGGINGTVIVPDPRQFRSSPTSNPSDLSAVYGTDPFWLVQWEDTVVGPKISYRGMPKLELGQTYTLVVEAFIATNLSGPIVRTVDLTMHDSPDVGQTWTQVENSVNALTQPTSQPYPWTPMMTHFTIDTEARATRVGFDILPQDEPTGGSNQGLLIRNIRVYKGRLESAPASSQAVDSENLWPYVRIKPRYMLDNVGSTPLGVFIPSAPVAEHDGATKSWDIELLDRTAALAECATDAVVTAAKGSSVVDFVQKMIRSTGEDPGARPNISQYGPDGNAKARATFGSTIVWGAGESVLTVINEALDACGFMALWTDGDGNFVIEPYLLPKYRPVRWEFVDGKNCIYLPRFSVEKDTYNTPNKVILIAQPEDFDEAPLIATAENHNPRSPLSYENRLRWITDVQRGVEATDQQVLNLKAKARLAQLSAVQGSITIEHGYVPGLRVNNVVRFRRQPAGIDGKFVVTTMTVPLDPQRLCKTTLTEVIDL